MTKLLSDHINDALAVLDTNTAPTEVRELVDGLRGTFEHLKRFAEAMESAHRGRPHVVPMWATSAAAAILYRELATGGTTAGRPVLLSVERSIGRRT